jgi:hypothetical protein
VEPVLRRIIAEGRDEEWLRPALRLLSALVPGQLRGFRVAELMAAKSWVAAGPQQAS